MTQIIVQWSIIVLLGLLHPYHVSMTEIQYNKTNKTLEISVRLFTEDIEKTIRKTAGSKVDLLNTKERNRSQNLLQQYIIQHLQIKADGKSVLMNFIGFEPEGGSIWTYFECPHISLLEALEVSNSLLNDLKEQQVNFIHIKAINSDETIRMDYPETYKKFILNQ